MTDREKLIELIEESDRRCCGAICEVCSYAKEGEVCQSAILADHLIANGVTVQKWIPASEPPEVRGEYIVYTPTAWNDRTVLIWDEQDWCFMDGAIAREGFVTHWMPMPQKPKECET